MTAPGSEQRRAMINLAARAVMETRVRWGWTFGKQRRVMAIDQMMAEAAIDAYLAALRTHASEGEGDA